MSYLATWSLINNLSIYAKFLENIYKFFNVLYICYDIQSIVFDNDVGVSHKKQPSVLALLLVLTE
jgi:hypothetical protein